MLIRDNTIGQYAYVMNTGGTLSVFGDRVGVYDIYYYSGEDGLYFVTNDLFDMVSVIRDKVSLHEMNLVEYASTFNVFGGETIFNEIFRLNGEQYLYIQNGILSVGKINITLWPLIENETVEDCAKKLAEKISYKAGVIARVLGAPTISMTGGLDSRMSLAAYLSAGVKPQVLYGRGNTFLVSPIKEDELVVDKLVQTYTLPHKFIDWDTTNPEQHWDEYLQRYGFVYRHWGASQSVFKTFENIDTKVYTFGWGGECYRNHLPIPSHAEPYSVQELVDVYGAYVYYTNNISYKLPKYKEHITRKFNEITVKYGLNPSRIMRNDIFYYYYEFSKFGDSCGPNLMNHIRYAPLLLFEADCMQLSRVAYEQREGARIMLETMRNLMPNIVDVEFCSGCHLQKLDANNMALVPTSARDFRRSKFELFLKTCYGHAKKVLKPFRNMYKVIENIYRPNSDNESWGIENPNAKLPQFSIYPVVFSDPRPEMYYRMLVRALQSLNFQPIVQ